MSRKNILDGLLVDARRRPRRVRFGVSGALCILTGGLFSAGAGCQPSDPEQKAGETGGSATGGATTGGGSNTTGGRVVTDGGQPTGGSAQGGTSTGGSAGSSGKGGSATTMGGAASGGKGGATGGGRGGSGGATTTGGAGGAVSKGGAGPVAGPSDRILYPNGQVQSPISASVATRLRDIVGAGKGDSGIFIKVGDAISQGLEYLGCVEDANLSTHTDLKSVIDFFSKSDIAGDDPFVRDSVATRENGTSWDIMDGDWIGQEVTAANPAYALIMFGSVDIGDGGTLDANARTDATKFVHYGQAMWTIADQLIASGIIPILRSMPPRLNDTDLAPQGPTMSMLVRAIAEGRQVPYSEFYGAMVKVPDSGLFSDGLHINSYSGGECVFTATGLMYGYNIMNLQSLESLDRVKRVVVDQVDAIDDDATKLAGAGTVAAPFEVPELPFTDMRDLAQATSKALSDYSGCSGKKESGGEFVYKVELPSAVRARAVVVERSGAKADATIHHFTGSAEIASCDGSNTTMIQKSFAAGTHYFVVDTAATAAAGDEYILTILPCEAQDSTCG
jgi:hypothetical protein